MAKQIRLIWSSKYNCKNIPNIATVPNINRSVITPYSASEMFSLAGDVDRYSEFLPWCNDSVILERTETEVLAKIVLAYKGWNTTFTTRNQMVPDQLIEMRLVEGAAFSGLSGDWRFRALDEMACEVSLDVNFSLAGKLGGRMLEPIFSRICNELIDAFIARAKSLYGERAFA